jgi:hypothetical protein
VNWLLFGTIVVCNFFVMRYTGQYFLTKISDPDGANKKAFVAVTAFFTVVICALALTLGVE